MPDGFAVELLVPNIAPGRTIAEIIQAQAAEFGIDVTLRPIDNSQMYATVSAFDYEMAYTGWTMDIPDPDQNIAFMFDFENGGGSSYSTGYNNPAMTELVRAGQKALDDEERARIYADIQALNAEEAPFIPLIALDAAFAWRDDVRGLNINPVGKQRMENVWLDR
jgi:peptide/nickel transport system substrate-binding protein